MTQLDPRIILSGDRFDLVGAIDAGQTAAARGHQFDQQRRENENTNALNAFVGQNGADIMAGNRNALNGLAGLGMQGLDAAQGVQNTRLAQDQTRLGMDATRQGMRHADANQARLGRAEQLKIQALASQRTAAENKAAAETMRRAVGMAYTPGMTSERYDALMAETAPDFVGKFENRDAFAYGLMDIADVLDSVADADAPPQAQSPMGKFYADQNAGLIPADATPPQSGVNITNNTGPASDQYGKPEAGYVWLYDESGKHITEPDATGRGVVPVQMPISGGSKDLSSVNEAAAAQQQQQAGVVLSTIDTIRQSLTKENEGGRKWYDAPETGIVGSRLASAGLNQEAVDMVGQLQVLQSAVAFDRLQAMREASPTGGALGAVSERELALLQSAMGALNNNLSPEALQATLDTIEGVMRKFEAYPNAAEFGLTGQGGGGAGGAGWQDMGDGIRVKER